MTSAAASVDDIDARAAWARHLGCRADEICIEALHERLTRWSVPQALAAAARTAPKATLAVGEDRVTYAALTDEVDRGAAALFETGLAGGDVVAIAATSSLDLVRAYLSVLRAGLVAVLVNPAYTASEIRGVLDRAGADLLVHDRSLEAPDAAAAALGLADLMDRARRSPRCTAPPPTSGERALLAFTSGTTGTPKGVPLTHAQLLSSAHAAMLAWRWRSSDVLVHCLPLFHQHGLSGVHASLLAGSSAHLLPRFDGDELLATVERTGASILFGVPAIHRRLLELTPQRLTSLRRLRLVTSGSGPLPPTLADDFESATGQRLLERFGLTETGLNLSNPYDGLRIGGSVGFPLPGVEVRLTDQEGTTVEDGADGEICVRGPQVFDGYLGDPEATSAAFWPGGWFRTGDLGRRDAEGRYAVTGRLKDLIITGGMNVSPAEVEAVVEEVDWVREAAVAGLPSEEWGEEVAAWVVARAGTPARPEEVIDHCHRRLAGYKRPKQVFVVPALPRNPLGKVLRAQLVETGDAR